MSNDAMHGELLALSADIVGAHVSNNVVAASELPTLISSVFNKLSSLGAEASIPVPAKQSPAVSIKASIKPDHLVCLEDGKKQRMLKRHLMTAHDLTPDAYRAKWNLPADYPMVSASYAAKRRAIAIVVGLGHSRTAVKGPGRTKIGLAKK